MASPDLTLEQVQQLSAAVAKYITVQHEAFLPTSVLLTGEERLALDGFFVPETLDGSRQVVLQNSRDNESLLVSSSGNLS